MTAIWRHCVVSSMLAGFVSANFASADVVDAEFVEAEIEVTRFLVNQQTLEQWIVGSQTSEGTVRFRFELQLKDEIARWNAACQLTTDQKRKFDLIGRGDIKRFFEEFDALIRQANDRSKNGFVDQATYIELSQTIRPMQVAYRKGLFGETSLLRKTVQNVLDAEQRQRLAKHLLRQRTELFETQLDTVIATINRVVTFRKDQDVEFRKLIKEQVPPPKAISPYCHGYVLYHLAKLPEEKIKPLFNEEQWQNLSLQLQNAGRYESTLKTYGMLPDDSSIRQEDEE